ncbi:hypothetical protein [Erythrobacter sp.]|uniref:hypothetical protein n=1 Tax=Erythrobacter sp. TaxID=1042 RepID=UPI0025B7B896|nr:hypothetical protein [Erythrobacter sp.]
MALRKTAYDAVTSIRFTATVTQHSIDAAPPGKSYHAACDQKRQGMDATGTFQGLAWGAKKAGFEADGFISPNTPE